MILKSEASPAASVSQTTALLCPDLICKASPTSANSLSSISNHIFSIMVKSLQLVMPFFGFRAFIDHKWVENVWQNILSPGNSGEQTHKLTDLAFIDIRRLYQMKNSLLSIPSNDISNHGQETRSMLRTCEINYCLITVNCPVPFHGWL